MLFTTSGVGATAVLEFFVWGVLMSLVCPQPLLASIAAIGSASLGTQLAIAGWTPSVGQFFAGTL
jgi:hypothetical protein